MTYTGAQKPRILLVDDEPHIIKTYKSILLGDSDNQTETEKERNKLHADIFGKEEQETRADLKFDLEFAKQGKEAVDLVKTAMAANRPFSVIFLDMRMPPGQNGFLTAKQIRVIDPLCNIVIVTAYTDIEVSKMATAILPTDKFYYIRKPFYPQEIQQFAIGLSSKWKLENELNAILEERLHRLTMTNIAFNEEMDQRSAVDKKLKETEKALNQKEDDLTNVSRTIDILFREKFDAQKEIEENILFNVNNRVLPFIEELKKQNLDKKGEKTLAILAKNLEDITSPFMSRISIKSYQLTSRELSIAQFISQGMSTKEISQIIGVSTRTIEFHRDQLRKKLKLNGTNKRLKETLMQLRLPTQN